MSNKTIASNSAERQGQKARVNGRATLPSFDDSSLFIPDIWQFDIKPCEWVVPDILARDTVNIWVGDPGNAKTYIAMKLAIAVARGEAFLGRCCQQIPVLISDLENPGFFVQRRLKAMGITESHPYLRTWGSWAIEIDSLPPPIMDPFYLDLCRELRPLIIFDHFRSFHDANENYSDEISPIMKRLRLCAACGAAILLLHHPPKNSSGSRGSGEIPGQVDVTFEQEKDGDIVTLTHTKNRAGEKLLTFSMEINWATTQLSLITADQKTQKLLAQFRKVIGAEPGITQNLACKQVKGGNKTEKRRVLDDYAGKEWRTEKQGSACCYWLLETGCPKNSGQFGTVGTVGSGQSDLDLSHLSPFRESGTVGQVPQKKVDGNRDSSGTGGSKKPPSLREFKD